MSCIFDLDPILPGFHPDPSIVRVGNEYFLATSSFEFYPGVPIYRSTDLVRWELIGHALTRKSQLQIATPEPGGGVWAPTLRFHSNVFYLATCSFQRFRPEQNERVWPRGFYVKTTNILDSDSWSDPIFFDEVGFDQDLFWDRDGTVYLSTTRSKISPSAKVEETNNKDFAIHVCKIDLETGDSVSPPLVIRESPSGIAEGSHLFQRGNYVYLLTAEGGTDHGHSEWVFRSGLGPYGPWEAAPHNPVLRHTTDSRIQNIGHADFVDDPNGDWWAVFLGIRVDEGTGMRDRSVLGRETFLVPVDWVNEWPVLSGQRCDFLKTKKAGSSSEEASETWRDDFSEPCLQLGWYFKNTPTKPEYSLHKRPNHLALHGGPYSLSTPASPTLLLRKQTAHFCTWETRLSFFPDRPFSEAGTVLWWNHFTQTSIGIRLETTKTQCDTMPTGPTRRVVVLRVADGRVVEQVLRDCSSDVVFQIKCGTKYEFGFGEVAAGDDPLQKVAIKQVGEVENGTMIKPPPTGMVFSGMMFGLYAFGPFEKCLSPARFHYAEIKRNCSKI